MDNKEGTGYRWIILAICWFGYVVAMTQRLSIGPLAPFIKTSLNLNNYQIGMFTSAVFVGYMVALVPAGLIVDRINERWVIGFSEILGGIFICCMFFIRGFYEGIIFMGLCGFGLGAILPATSKAIMLWFTEKERATAMGIKHTSINVGGILGAVSFPVLALATSWRHCFLAAGLMGIFVGLMTLLIYRTHPFTHNTSAQHTESFYKSLKKIIQNKDIILVSLVGFFATVEFAIITFFVLFLKEELRYAVVTGGFLLATLEAGGAFGKPLFGLISDKIMNGSRKKVYLIICSLWCLGAIFMALASKELTTSFIIIICALLGMACIGWSGLHFTLVAELAGKELVGSATGFTSVILSLGALTWPVFLGKIIDWQGYKTAWLVISVLGGISFFLIKAVQEKDTEVV